MTILKITLTPLDKFFFGGEVVFGSGEGGGQGERQRSYLVHSNILPQQTSLLGLLREQLLAQNGLLYPWNSPAKEAEATALVNKTGFNVIFKPDSTQADLDPGQFGVIEELSPLFLEDESGKRWQPVPLDDVIGREDKKMVFEWDEDAKRPQLKNLDPKNALKLHFTSGNENRKKVDDFFAETKQVGITVTNRRKNDKPSADITDDDEAFYWQTFQRNHQSAFAEAILIEKHNQADKDSKKALFDEKRKQAKSAFSFTFFVKMTAAFNSYKLENAHVNFGGERSAFNMEVKEVSIATGFDDLFQPVKYEHTKIDAAIENDFQRIVLMSDTYADWQELNKHCALAVMETVSFRFFTTILGKTENFYDFKKEKKGTELGKTQSALLTLIRRGSVFYIRKTDVEHVEKILKAQTAFRQIGYNYFKTI